MHITLFEMADIWIQMNTLKLDFESKCETYQLGRTLIIYGNAMCMEVKYFTSTINYEWLINTMHS